MFIKICDMEIKMRLTEISLRKISAVTIIVFTAMGLVLTYSTAGLISFQNANSKVNRQLPSSGNIAAINVGLYSDYACTLKMESIDWGDIAPGESVNRVIYLKNTGNTQILLSMTANDWTPSYANGPITLTWNKEGTLLDPGEVTSATLTLATVEDISGVTTFSVSILIIGTAQ
jgi:hypothetical protein